MRAQTILQLDAQLEDAGWSEGQRVEVRSAYELVMQLFAGCYRPCGRTFQAHAVGVASVLARLGAPTDLVVAGLLHAAYRLGDFADTARGATPARRALVRSVVGERAERWIRAYPELSWKRDSIARWAAAPESLSPKERGVVLIRLANELDEWLDRGPAYSGKAASRRAKGVPGPELLVLARAVAGPELADALATAVAETEARPVPAALRGPRTRSFFAGSSQPPIVRPRWGRHALRRLARRLRRVGRSAFASVRAPRGPLRPRPPLPTAPDTADRHPRRHTQPTGTPKGSKRQRPP